MALGKQHGRAEDGYLNIDYGWKFAGPVSEPLLLNEATRLHRVALSVRDRGLLRHDGPYGDILAAALMAEDGNWRWSIISGHHRVAALAASGYPTFPVRIQRIVSRSDVNLWPNVINGLFTPTEALAVFDNLFHARSASAHAKRAVSTESPNITHAPITAALQLDSLSFQPRPKATNGLPLRAALRSTGPS